MRAAVVGGVGAAAYHSGKRHGADQEQPESAQPTTPTPAQPAAQPASPATTADRLSALERLSALRDQGVLSPEEFEIEKSKILSGD